MVRGHHIAVAFRPSDDGSRRLPSFAFACDASTLPRLTSRVRIPSPRRALSLAGLGSRPGRRFACPKCQCSAENQCWETHTRQGAVWPGAHGTSLHTPTGPSGNLHWANTFTQTPVAVGDFFFVPGHPVISKASVRTPQKRGECLCTRGDDIAPGHSTAAGSFGRGLESQKRTLRDPRAGSSDSPALQMVVRWIGLQPWIFDWAAHREVIEHLKTIALQPEDTVGHVVEKASDPCPANTGGFCLEVEDTSLSVQPAIEPGTESLERPTKLADNGGGEDAVSGDRLIAARLLSQLAGVTFFEEEQSQRTAPSPPK